MQVIIKMAVHCLSDLLIPLPVYCNILLVAECRAGAVVVTLSGDVEFSSLCGSFTRSALLDSLQSFCEYSLLLYYRNIYYVLIY